MNDLHEVFYSALSLASEENYFVEAKYYPYAGLKSTIRRDNDRIIVKVSDGFENASREVLLGLALVLVGKAFRKKFSSELTMEFKEFVSRKTATELHNELRKNRGRVKETRSIGAEYDLNALMQELFVEYPEILVGINTPVVTWSEKRSRRRLGWHDASFNKITLNKGLDSERVPAFVVKNVLFHELLHCKHDVKYQRGASLRRTVHTREFKADEKQFRQFEEAERWTRNYF